MSSCIHLWIAFCAFVDYEKIFSIKTAHKSTNSWTPPTVYSNHSYNLHIALTNPNMLLLQPITLIGWRNE